MKGGKRGTESLGRPQWVMEVATATMDAPTRMTMPLSKFLKEVTMDVIKNIYYEKHTF